MLQCLMFRTVLVLAGLLAADAAAAADVCPLVRNRQSAPDVATRIAAVACSEHMLWYRPFIDAQGRLASVSVAEAENTGSVSSAMIARRKFGWFIRFGLVGFGN